MNTVFPSSFRRQVPRFLFRGIGLVLLIIILVRIEWTTLFTVISSARVSFLFLALPFFGGMLFFRALRWHVILRNAGLPCSSAEVCRQYLQGIAYGMITPGKIGQHSKVFLLRQHGISFKVAAGLSLFDQLFDQFVCLLLALPAAALLFAPSWVTFAVILSAIVVVGMFLFLPRARSLRWVHKRERVRHLFHPSHFFMSLLLTLLGWGCLLVYSLFVACSILPSVSVWVLLSVFILSTIVTSIPIAPFGLGTRETTFLFLLLSYGVAPEASVAWGFLLFATGLLYKIPIAFFVFIYSS